MPPGGSRSVLAPRYPYETIERQAMWLTCCQSCEVHRFDCGLVPIELRSAGPVIRRRA